MDSSTAALAAHTADVCRELIRVLTALPQGPQGPELRAAVLDAAQRLGSAAADPEALPQHDGGEPPLLSRLDGATVDRSPVTARLNPLAPPLSLSGADGSAEGRARMSVAYQGPPGRLHGGYAAVLLDHVLGHAAHSVDDAGFTRYLHLTYEAGTPLEEDLTVRAAVDRREGRKTFVRGEITAGGQVTVRAEGLWVRPRED